MKSFAIRAPEGLIEDFRTVAAAEDRSFSAELRHIMRVHIERLSDPRTDEAALTGGPVESIAGGVGDHAQPY